MESLVVPAIAGIFGANAGACILKELNLGIVGNSIAGILAGCLTVAGASRLGLDFASSGFLQEIALSASAGVALMAAAGFAYNRMI